MRPTVRGRQTTWPQRPRAAVPASSRINVYVYVYVYWLLRSTVARLDSVRRGKRAQAGRRGGGRGGGGATRIWCFVGMSTRVITRTGRRWRHGHDDGRLDANSSVVKRATGERDETDDGEGRVVAIEDCRHRRQRRAPGGVEGKEALAGAARRTCG